MSNIGQGYGIGDGNSAFVLLLEYYIWRLFIDTDTKPLQLSLDDLFVCQWLVNVQDDEDEMTSLGYCYDLTTTTLAIFSTLNDTRKIQHLNGSPIVLDLTGYCCQSCELVGSR